MEILWKFNIIMMGVGNRIYWLCRLIYCTVILWMVAKSCTTLDGWNPINTGINYLWTGAEFRNHPPYHGKTIGNARKDMGYTMTLWHYGMKMLWFLLMFEHGFVVVVDTWRITGWVSCRIMRVMKTIYSDGSSNSWRDIMGYIPRHFPRIRTHLL